MGCVKLAHSDGSLEALVDYCKEPKSTLGGSGVLLLIQDIKLLKTKHGKQRVLGMKDAVKMLCSRCESGEEKNRNLLGNWIHTGGEACRAPKKLNDKIAKLECHE